MKNYSFVFLTTKSLTKNITSLMRGSLVCSFVLSPVFCEAAEIFSLNPQDPVYRGVIPLWNPDRESCCSGSLVSWKNKDTGKEEKGVLTAAHCITNPSLARFSTPSEERTEVALGSKREMQWLNKHRKAGGSPLMNLTCVPHPFYVAGLARYDAAICHLSAEAPAGSLFYPLYPLKDNEKSGESVSAGWSQPTLTVRKGTMSIENKEIVRASYSADAGDSGGPQFINRDEAPAVVGIASSGLGEETRMYSISEESIVLFSNIMDHLGQFPDASIASEEVKEWINKAYNQSFIKVVSEGIDTRENLWNLGAGGDDKQRRFFFRKAADQGHADAQYSLAVMLDDGRGGPVDQVKAREYYKRAADQGNVKAQNNLAVMMKLGEGGPEDLVLAREYYKRAADQENANAQYGLAMMFDKGEGGPEDKALAREYFQKASDQGYKGAQYNLAKMLLDGEGGPVDHVLAREYFQKAADHGYKKAQYNLAVMLCFGEGGPVDQVLAREYFQKAADQGVKDAQHNLAKMLLDGEGGPVDHVLAREYYKKAADQENVKAQYMFASMLYRGAGGPKSLELALEYFKKAADQGDANAQYGLAMMLYQGEGGSKDHVLARSYFKKVADQGRSEAQYMFASMLYLGEGGPQDLALAREYYQKAADQGLSEAKSILNDMDVAEL